MPEPVNISLLKDLTANTRKFLDLSTAHVRCEDIAWLDANTHTTDNGWLVYSALNKSVVDDCPDTISNLNELARAMGCCYILLDSDGPIIKGLPEFHWD